MKNDIKYVCEHSVMAQINHWISVLNQFREMDQTTLTLFLWLKFKWKNPLKFIFERHETRKDHKTSGNLMAE